MRTGYPIDSIIGQINDSLYKYTQLSDVQKANISSILETFFLK